jgi:Ca2+-binding RTX toxin-like protein
MATLTYGEALGNFGDPYVIMDLLHLTILTATSTSAAVEDGAGNGFTVEGTGFTYSATGLTGGMIESFDFYDATDAQLMTITGIGYDIQGAGFSLDPLEEAIGYLLDGNDRVIGSSSRDLIAGGGGNDVMFGNGGGDYLIAMGGRDRMTGGGGRDEFVFLANRGRDKILDFADDNLASDDLIAMTRHQYRNMTITQNGSDVLLQFGSRGELLIADATLADIGRDDFTFNNPLHNL